MYAYTFVYKCRRCGEKYNGALTTNKILATTILFRVLRDGIVLDCGIPVAKEDIHNCADGSRGVSDIIGLEAREEGE